ncbi:hypothetical protein AVEN_152288-1 [Araneus ventricosus]|uniref:Uncharacterized protein n=1 Tax=Araneus ventricosus TaxID=182803 RepID=A0A4Y2K6Y6_ARAVE|nr:hypothetical protein AVEN_152288-1 [Araneus ventricosus]
MVSYRPQCRRARVSKHGSTEAHCTLNHMKGDRRHAAGVVQNLGERRQLRCRSRLLTVVQNCEVRPKSSPRVASKRDANINKLQSNIGYFILDPNTLLNDNYYEYLILGFVLNQNFQHLQPIK